MAKQFEIRNDPDLIPPLVEKIAALVDRSWAGVGFSPMNVTVALQEAITNAVFHGNLGLSSKLREDGSGRFYEVARERRDQAPWCDRVVRIEVLVTARAALFIVTDEGDGFDPSSIRECHDGSGLYKLHGRGIAMMQTLMDEVNYSNGGRTVTMKLIRKTESA